MSATGQTAQVVAAGGRPRMGRVVANTGRDVLVLMETEDRRAGNLVRLGDMVVVGSQAQAAVGIVSGMNEPAPGLDGEGADLWIAQVELVGTLGMVAGDAAFTRSVAVSPSLGDVAYRASPSDLRRLYRNDDSETYPIGNVIGQADVAATIDPNPLLAGGFAIFGGPASGKSSTLASLVRALLRHRHATKIVLIDPYNEYGRSFGKAAQCLEPKPGFLPYWLLSFKELSWTLSRNGGALSIDEISLLEEAIPAARIKFRDRQSRGRDSITPEDRAAATVECPMPYRMSDLLSYLEKPADDDARPIHAFRRLRTRVLAALSDPRFGIFFGPSIVVDNLGDVLRNIFRIDQSGPPMSVLQLGSLASGVDRLAVSVVCRMATALAEWGGGAHRTLLLIDDVGRYAPAEVTRGSEKISREALLELGGRPRKLGTTLGLVCGDARNAGRDVLGQCATYFVHRMTSQTEMDAVQDMLPEAANAFLGGVSNLGVAETIAVGQGVPVTGRFQIATLPAAAVPTEQSSIPPAPGVEEIDRIVERWRACGNVSAGHPV